MININRQMDIFLFNKIICNINYVICSEISLGITAELDSNIFNEVNQRIVLITYQ